jgi:hypothetical protein
VVDLCARKAGKLAEEIRAARKAAASPLLVKRLAPSPYAAQEKVRGTKLAEPVHALSLEMNESVVVEVEYKIELTDVPDEYLGASSVRAVAIPVLLVTEIAGLDSRPAAPIMCAEATQ